MDAHHVAHSLLLFVLVQISSSTDILMTYGHNVLLLRSANSNNFSEPTSLVTPPLHFPYGLAYRPASRDAGQGGLAFVSDTQSGEASVFALQLSNDHVVQHKEPVIRRSPQSLGHAVYSAAEHTLYVSSLLPVPGVSRSRLSLNITKHWSSMPSLVTSAQIGTVRGVTLDQCSGNLYWSETSNSSSSVSVLPTLRSSLAARVLPLPNTTSSFYQGLHHDEASKSLIIAVTDSDNYTTSSCRFISYRETRDANEQTTDPESTSNDVPYEISVIAENISDCYPFALSTDRDYIYFSDWSRRAVMRLNKADPHDLVELFATPPSKLLARWRYGAYDVLALNDELQQEKSCSFSKFTSVEPSTRSTTDMFFAKDTQAGETKTSSEGPTVKTEPVNDYPNDAAFKSFLSNKLSKDRFIAGEAFETFTPSSLTTGSVTLKKELQAAQGLNSISGAPVRDGVERHKETRSGIGSSVDSSPSTHASSLPRAVLEYPHEFLLHNAYQVENHPQKPLNVDDSEAKPATLLNSAGWFPGFSREELVCAIFVLLILCGVLFVVTTILLIRQLNSWHKSRSAPRAGRLGNGRRAYEEVENCPARANRSGCSIDIEQANQGNANGTTDLIIDLSQDDIQVNSDLHAAAGRRKKKKTFGPKNGSIKHLISKSFSKDGLKGSSTGCPGLQSSDGVTLNIEDCCQMTLCETPCYTSVRKEGKGYRSSGAAADDDQTTLLDDEQHTLC